MLRPHESQDLFIIFNETFGEKIKRILTAARTNKNSRHENQSNDSSVELNAPQSSMDAIDRSPAFAEYDPDGMVYTSIADNIPSQILVYPDFTI